MEVFIEREMGLKFFEREREWRREWVVVTVKCD